MVVSGGAGGGGGGTPRRKQGNKCMHFNSERKGEGPQSPVPSPPYKLLDRF